VLPRGTRDPDPEVWCIPSAVPELGLLPPGLSASFTRWTRIGEDKGPRPAPARLEGYTIFSGP